MEMKMKYTNGGLNVFPSTFLALKYSKQNSGSDTKQSELEVKYARSYSVVIEQFNQVITERDMST
jgi:hypothetical protein